MNEPLLSLVEIGERLRSGSPTVADLVRHVDTLRVEIGNQVARLDGRVGALTAHVAGDFQLERKHRAREDDRLNSLLERMGREIPEEMEARSAAILDRVRESYGNQEPRSTRTTAEGSGSVGIVDPGPAESVRETLRFGAKVAALLAAVDTVLVNYDACGTTSRPHDDLRKAREAFR